MQQRLTSNARIATWIIKIIVSKVKFLSINKARSSTDQKFDAFPDFSSAQQKAKHDGGGDVVVGGGVVVVVCGVSNLN